MTNRQAYNKLKSINHRFTDRPYDAKLDYLSEYKSDKKCYDSMIAESKVQSKLEGLSREQLIAMLPKWNGL